MRDDIFAEIRGRTTIKMNKRRVFSFRRTENLEIS